MARKRGRRMIEKIQNFTAFEFVGFIICCIIGVGLKINQNTFVCK